MFVPYVVIKLLSVWGRGFCCCKFMVCNTTSILCVGFMLVPHIVIKLCLF